MQAAFVRRPREAPSCTRIPGMGCGPSQRPGGTAQWRCIAREAGVPGGTCPGLPRVQSANSHLGAAGGWDLVTLCLSSSSARLGSQGTPYPGKRWRTQCVTGEEGPCAGCPAQSGCTVDGGLSISESPRARGAGAGLLEPRFARALGLGRFLSQPEETGLWAHQDSGLLVVPSIPIVGATALATPLPMSEPFGGYCILSANVKCASPCPDTEQPWGASPLC